VYVRTSVFRDLIGAQLEPLSMILGKVRSRNSLAAVASLACW
jgi:hypothetical protein